MSDQVVDQIRKNGFAVFDAARPHPDVAALVARPDWAAFAASWSGMARDEYMADGGKYRRRRYKVFDVTADAIRSAPHQPHFQTTSYNHLNGGIERWFEAVPETVASGPIMSALLRLCERSFSKLSPDVKTWHAEVHQFRIEAQGDDAGNPTPEGMHRDGVDYVLVLMIARENIKSGTTTMADADKRPLGSFTLTSAGDCVLLDDHRVYHGVTPVLAADASTAAHRDVLVVTFRDDAKTPRA